MAAVARGIACSDVRVRVIDEPGGQPDDEDHRAERDEHEAEEDAEREDRYTEANDHG